MTGRFVFRAVKALVRVTLSDSSRIRPHRIYRAPGMPDLATKWVVLWQVKFCAFGQKKPGWTGVTTRWSYHRRQQHSIRKLFAICVRYFRSLMPKSGPNGFGIPPTPSDLVWALGSEERRRFFSKTKTHFYGGHWSPTLTKTQK